MKLKQLFSTILILTLLLGLCACGKNDDSASAAVTLADGESGSFTVAVCSRAGNLNPFSDESELAEELYLLVYDSLWRIGSDGEPVNCLVDSYDLSSDGLTWTIRLRRDVSFSDGEALTGADVKFSWELFRQYGSDSELLFDGINSIKCPDDYTLIITTDYVKGDMLYNDTPILPEHIWSAYDTDPAAMDNRAMIGSGPFVYQMPELAAGEEQTQWSLLARLDYFGGSAHFGTLVFRNYETPAYAANDLADGLVDACMDLTEVQSYSLADETGTELFFTQSPTRGCCLLMMNTASGALADSVVREAILYAIDRDSVFEMGFGGTGLRGDGFIGPGSPYYLDGSDHYGYAPEKSSALLAGSLYDDYDGDGVLESRDNTMELSFRLFSDGDAWATAAASILTRDLAALGMEINWVTKEEKELTNDCREGGDWDLCLLCLEGSFDPQDMAAAFSDSRSATGWEDSSFDSLYASLLTCLDVNEKRIIVQQMQELAAVSYPGAVLGYSAAVQAIRSDRWTGYDSVCGSVDGLFGIGCLDAYMAIRSVAMETETEESAQAAESEQPALFRNEEESGAGSPAPMATAVPREE